MTKTMCTNKIR